MDMVKTNGFAELSVAEMESCDGGSITIALIAIGGKTIAITLGNVLTAIGTAWAAGHIGNEIYNAFK